MALKYFQLLFSVTIFFLVSSNICLATRHAPDEKNVHSPFEFIKHLEGCHKGNKSKEIQLLKNYLQRFGYLDLDQAHADDDIFDDALEAAVKTYQSNFHINPTGILDVSTVLKMVVPRCGVPDIFRGMNSMLADREKHDSGSAAYVVSHYSFFPNSPRWPPTKTHLTYNILPDTPSNAVGPVRRAFNKWASATHFTFSQVQGNQGADLVIGFFRRDHGDGQEFDGPGGTLAHAFAPTTGRFHYDADEPWVDGMVTGAFDLETVAIHEIGHLLGLGHSSVEGAIMYPSIPDGVTKNLHEDDIRGIRALYNV
ncbi:metalloendoproteinase 3-MMP-like [Primulina huaijiensis]|uniref:metalloendoproteinase 3-MMP-like n=1 Tax=Primulina huaijiensis TaxID=1492673 RepID=UPI003CC73FE1